MILFLEREHCGFARLFGLRFCWLTFSPTHDETEEKVSTEQLNLQLSWIKLEEVMLNGRQFM